MAGDNDRADEKMTAAVGRHARIVDDLSEETDSLHDMLRAIDADRWSTPTPAVGWTIHDQISHLAHFDQATLLALADPDRFRREAAELTAPGDDFPDRLVRGRRALTPQQSAGWFERSRSDLLTVVRSTSGLRIPWYGPDMSITSAVTARLMETWAHGQDIADALGITRTPTDRLRHIAHLGIATRAFSFQLHGMLPPDEEPFVELTAPGGDIWQWGSPAAGQAVTGTALDFCLLVTQRRHLSDTALTLAGDEAVRWMSLAQAFAGVPGPGRSPVSDQHSR